MNYTIQIYFRIARGIFFAAFLGFSWLCLMLFVFSGFMEGGDREHFLKFGFSGFLYLLGSILCIREKIPLTMLLIVGVLLNLIGASVWVTSIGSNDGYLAVVGVILTVLWVLCVSLRIANYVSPDRIDVSDK